MSAERWLPIVGFNGYEVSDRGRVRSLPRSIMRTNGSPQWVEGRILKQPLVDGYPSVSLCRKTIRTHILLLAAFVGPRPERLVTRHRNGDRTDCRLANLTYGTRSENMQDRKDHGRDPNLRKTHCRNKHVYAGDNLILVADGSRACRECGRARARRYAARQRNRAAT
jgi:hypothetical protein